MAKCGSCNFSDLIKLQDRLKKFSDREINTFLESCAKELAARLLAKVVKRTPTRKPENCSPGVTGGTLKRGWTAGKSSNAAAYAGALKVNHSGGFYVIEIVNPTEYASYVEFGHRTRNHKGWVRGVFMLTISEQEVDAAAPAVLEAKLMKKLGDCFG